LSEVVKLLIIDTGLFDTDTALKSALDEASEHYDVTRVDARGSNLSDSHWDAVIDAILESGKIVSL